MFAQTPEPPYYAVIFTSRRTEVDEGYAQSADEMMELAAKQPGFLGVERARSGDGEGVSVSYWDSLEAIAAWKGDVDHLTAQRLGREKWYRAYVIRIARVERQSRWEPDK